jgi:CTP:molybdopterin cytidylyltransferase MocA
MIANALILAAGNSSRLNFPKSLLKFNSKQTFLEKLIYEYQSAGIQQIIIVLNSPTLFTVTEKFQCITDSCTLVLNSFPEKERFYSISIGLRAMKKNVPTFIQNVDQPFTETELITQLYNLVSPYGSIVPHFNEKKGNPLLIQTDIISFIQHTTNYQIRFNEVVESFPIKILQSDKEYIVNNINTKEDYRKFFDYDIP